MFPEYEIVNDNLIKSKCLSCNKYYLNKTDEELRKQFKITFKFSDNDINKFTFLLRKSVYSYEYMNDWEKPNEKEKEEFYSNLNMEDIANAVYMDVKTVCKDFEIKHLGEYHDFYLKSDTLLLTDVFENFRKLCFKICHLDPVKFLSAPGLLWQTASKKTK